MSMTTTAQASTKRLAWPTIFYIGGMHVLALLALVPSLFSWSGLLIGLALHWLTGGVGICLVYHRLLTHRSFKLWPKWLEYPLTMIGMMASEGGAIGWVADHRRHHAYSDEELDTHSPLRGLFWAHMGWFMVTDEIARPTEAYYKRWAPDLYRDPVQRWLNSAFILFPLGLFAALYAAGQWYGGMGLSWLVWGGFVRTLFVWHTTWLVNSASHVWGYRSHATRDQSTNLWWCAALTYGEGWHNNHHAFQTSARHGLDWWEVDPTYWTIKVMQGLGLASDIKLPKIRKNADGSLIETDVRPAVPPRTAAEPASAPVPAAVEQVVKETKPQETGV
ncbi:acyl-CoA desaturase [Paludisphaera rhizosphaerae]|uniref:acyl-CoA desaturase n=1 Tax=Paludisphaera rhizosphaerae TaxID=2711216 RepID=UPI0013EB67E1|nr:fatty acid desaturase [Paludisphaera rhizosphaerae]